jgi:protocatechuate 3,4-dioxygenase beta subunit
MRSASSHRFHLTRRGLLLGGTATLLSPKGFAATPSCVLASEQEEGPYYVDGAKFRRDLTEGKPGVPIKLKLALVDSRRCTPLADAAIDVWHCDAVGVYSGFTSNNPDGPGNGPGRGPGPDGRGPGPGGPGPGGGPPPGEPPPPDGAAQFRPGGPPGFGPGGRGPRKVDDTRFLRGVQLTDPQGLAEFATVYPGWYSGRAIHIHLKVHLGGEHRTDTYLGGHVSHTGQLFFPEDITTQVARLEPYAKRARVHRTTQDEDHIFQSQHGSSSLVRLERIRQGTDAEGFVATVTLAIDPDAMPAPVSGRGPFAR